MEEMAYNPVLLFKPQGPQENDKSLNLSDDDFLLAIQMEFQKDAMLQFGKKVILMDATHGTTQYDFLLISVALNDHVEEQQDKIEIYHQLCVLLQEREENQFMIRLQQLMSFLSDNYPNFHQYFNTQYVKKVKEWATCFRIGTIVNTNMFVESFHRLLKVNYLNNKQNCRVDRLIHVLLRIARNLIYEQLNKVEKIKSLAESMRLTKDINLL